MSKTTLKGAALGIVWRPRARYVFLKDRKDKWAIIASCGMNEES